VKLAIVGAGEVGATAGYACLLRGVAQKLVICDLNRAKAEAHALDLMHSVQFAQMVDVRGTDDLAECEGAGVVVLAAGAKQKPSQTRLDLAADNVAMCRAVIPEVLKAAPDALLLMVTNPVDVLTKAAIEVSGLDPARVLGTGTVLDTSRFRALLAQRCRVAVQNVHAYIVGEHGDSAEALWSSATIGGLGVEHWGPSLGGVPDEEERHGVLDDVRRAAYRIVAGKGATSHAIGVVTARVVEAIDRDERRVLPVTSYLADYQGITDVCMSVPCVVDHTGVGERLEVPMDAAEHEGLAASAQVIRDACATVGL
jgi:L-lactate dehydrogenase